MKPGTRLTIAGATAITSLVALTPGYAHKPITSPYAFAEDVAPILREHCSSCHVSGGIAPMALGTYEETVPWAESMRMELVAGHMPPWGIEGGGSWFRNVKPLTARELNVLLTWASGGTPPGAPTSPSAKPETMRRTWPLGEPDLRLQPVNDFVMPADVQERVEEFPIDTGTTETRWLRAVDVMPGDPTVVRRATVSLAPEASPGTAERLLALWVPGDVPVPSDQGAFLLPAGARLVLRIHYRKTWQRERDLVRDRSSVGLYFAPPSPANTIHAALLTPQPSPASTIRAASLTPQPPDELRLDQGIWPWRSSDVLESTGETITFSWTSGATAARAVAIYADAGVQGVTVQVRAIYPAGRAETLITFRPQADWARRYWFREPVGLGPGTRVEVRATRDEPALLPPGVLRRDPVDLTKIRLTLDVVPMN